MRNQIEWLYLNNSTDTVRYVLGEKSDKMVACIGINPSTARPGDLDNTLKSVKRISEFNGFDGWVMYNVYPQRATDPDDLDLELDNELRLTNIGVLIKSIQHLNIDTIWLSYGDLIECREYLPFCLVSLIRGLSHLKIEWKIIGEPTQKGHPRHPLYKSTESRFVSFNIEDYMARIIEPKLKGFDKIYVDGITINE